MLISDTTREIDNITFKHLMINSVIALAAAVFIYAVFDQQQQFSWWSLCILATCVGIVSIDDILSWMRWQSMIERALAKGSEDGYWAVIAASDQVIRAEIGNEIYPDRILWHCDLMSIRQLDDGMPTERRKALVFMHPDGPVPIALEVDNTLLLLKPTVKGMSMSLVDSCAYISAVIHGFFRGLFRRD
jgi:hypothetical protein